MLQELEVDFNQLPYMCRLPSFYLFEHRPRSLCRNTAAGSI